MADRVSGPIDWPGLPGALRSIGALAERFGRTDALYAELPDTQAFERHIGDMLRRNMRLFAACIVFATLFWGVLDLFVQPPGVEGVFVRYRTLTTSVLVVGALLLEVPFLRRHPVRVVELVGAINGFLVGRWMGQLGGPETPWFHFTYMLGFIPILSPVGLFHRVVMVGVGFGLVVAGYLSADPVYAESELFGVLVTFVLFAWWVSVMTGEVVYGVYWRGFVNARRFAALARDLEGRVRDQTAEIRGYAHRIEAVAEGERTRIAHELHDELGQELTALRYAVALARQRFDADPSAIGGNLRVIEQLVGSTGETARRLVTDLRPKVVEALGLEGALEWLIAQTRERFALEVELELLDVGRVPSTLALPAFRSVQEALTNVVRHAGAARVWVRVERRGEPDDALEIAVSDDGRGMDATELAQAERRGALGLVGMRERARAQGGMLSIEPRTGGGSTVRLVVPVAAAESGAAP
jgi:signal transduction histidine kinase